MVRSGLALASLAAALAFCRSAPAAESIIHMKDGSVVKGEIVSQSDTEIKVKVRFGSVSYSKNEIARIETQGGGAAKASNKAAEWRDVLVLDTGDTMTGLIFSETDDAIIFDMVMSGSSVSKTMLMQTSVSRDKIKEIRKLTAAQRTEARQYLISLKQQAKRDSVAEGSLKIEPTEWPTKIRGRTIPAKKVELEHFVVEANTDESFLRKAAYRQARVFNAYKEHFGVDRNDSKKVRVLILNSMEEFYAAIGNKIKNPAFYSPDRKLVAAGCDMAKYKSAIAAIRQQHADLNSRLDAQKARIDKARADVRQAVNDFSAKINNAGRTTPLAKEYMKQLRRAQTRWEVDVMRLEKPVKEIQKQIRLVNRKNDMAFDRYTERMFATLYHEGFHAFLDQFLFDDELVKHVPRWLNEGLAQYFELARLEGTRLVLGREDRVRMAVLRRLQAGGGLVTLEEMLSAGAEEYIVEDMSDAETSTKHYLQAWLLVHMLGEKGKLTKENLTGFVKALAGGAEPMQALPKLTGMSNAELRKAWNAKLRESSIKFRAD